MIVVELQVLFRKTKVLSDSHPCLNTHYRCCCRNQPNQGDSEEVIVVRIASAFSKVKVLSDSHLCLNNFTDVVVVPNQGDSEEVIVVVLQVLFRNESAFG